MKPNKIKTESDLRQWCQEVANLTGCVVTVDSDGTAYLWKYGINKEIPFFDSSIGEWDIESNKIFDFSDPATALKNSGFSMTDPQNWIFEPEKE